MEVVRRNFKEALPWITESINRADFMAIDAEFTGLLNGQDVSIFDNPEEYYARLYSGCSDFLLIQFGLCTFYWDKEKGHYMNDAYNFYLFPRGKPGPEKMFLCQSSSLDFLSAQGFDFNKMIKEGISYMTMTTETLLRDDLKERQKRKDKDVIPVPQENKQQIDDICKKVREFLDNGEEDCMEIDRCNAFVRLLLFQELKARFKDEVIVETKILENKNRVLNVIRVTPDINPKDLDAIKKKKEWDEFEEAVGFSKVARLISQSEKLVIGHNMLLDVMHTLNHFFDPLPSEYTMFKDYVHCMFPKLLDTKLMSSMAPFKDKVSSSVLADLLATLCEPPFAMPRVESLPTRGYSRAVPREHEAGYDAYVTGCCFLALLDHLKPGGRLEPRLGLLHPYMNKLYLAKTAHQDSPYMYLSGLDPTPSRDHVFHLTFPEEWGRNDLNNLFSAFGPITVQFMDSSSAMIALSRREQAGDVVRALANNKRVKLLPYCKYKAMCFRSGNKIGWHETSTADKCKYIKKPEPNAKQVSRNIVSVGGAQTQRLPEKVARTRTHSASAAPAPAPSHPTPIRKRKSSGVSEDDGFEPEADLKKKKPIRSQSEDARTRPEVEPNRRRKTDSESSETKNKKKGVIEKFDIEAKSTCVTAFKESESWD